MKVGPIGAALALGLVALACGQSAQPLVIPTLAASPFVPGRTAYGFFPTPPDLSSQSVQETYRAIGQHADVVLLQEAIPWTDFSQDVQASSSSITDIETQCLQAHENGLDVIFVVDPLNGLNRREFAGLPSGWKPSFGNPQIRSAFTNFTLRILRQFHPHYLGLGSEVNTYADTHPDDYPNYLSLYRSTYDRIKSESPGTQVFVTFQWEELNNLIPALAAGKKPLNPNWDQVEAFEPRLDVWAISTYPFVAFGASAVPSTYYTPLLLQTARPLAVAEGGIPSQNNGTFKGSPQAQVDYLNAIHSQIGGRLAFWIYLLYNDFNLTSFAPLLILQGHASDLGTLSWFATLGLTDSSRKPKPALAAWDQFRLNATPQPASR